MITLLLAFQEENRFLEKILKDLSPKVNELVVILCYEPKPKELKLFGKYPCKLIKKNKEYIEVLLQQGIDESSGDWILMLRENEYLDSIALLMLKEEYFKEDAYAFRRKCFLRGVDNSLHFFFDFPNPQIRLFKKKCKWDLESNSIIGYNTCRFIPGHMILDNLHIRIKRFAKTLPIINSSIDYREMESSE
jgi:hypothetical protein